MPLLEPELAEVFLARCLNHYENGLKGKLSEELIDRRAKLLQKAAVELRHSKVAEKEAEKSLAKLRANYPSINPPTTWSV